MAAAMSAKRPRALTTGVDLVSGAQSSRNKRPRHSPHVSDDDHESNVPSDVEADEAQDDAHDVEQMNWATQQVQKDFRATANKQNIATDSGIIEEIQCINFMCHEHLTVSLGPLINFIIGHNGSGKSAVLTALTICLGGKATATNRAQNLKSLIKEGRDYSSVQVRIKNQGALAYKPEQYGDSITVERHFNRSGTSGFKLRDENGRVVSTKKAELEDILDAFSMQIDNPMNVLTQDMARQFLNHSTPKDKYKFFLQGTQLEHLNKDYQQIEQYLELMNTQGEVNKADIARLRKKMEELTTKAQRAESLERMRAKETELAHQALWAKVQEEEAELAAADAEIENVTALVEKRQAMVTEASEAFERSGSAHEAAVQKVEDLTSEMEPANQTVQELKAVFDEIKKKLVALMSDQRTADRDITMKANKVEEYKRDIEKLRVLQRQADDGLYEQKEREVQEAKIAMDNAREAFTTHGTELPSLQQQVRTDQQQKQAADKKVTDARAEEQSVLRNIKGLQDGQRSWVEGYRNPGDLQTLLRAIESATFNEKPVGPVGRYVTLLRSEWGSILEKQFGNTLNAFVVTSRADQSILTGLMKRCKWSAPIYIGKPDPIDTSRNEPDTSLLTWMRAVKIENHLVRNQLIINLSFEQTVLIEKRKEGQNFMDGRPRNVKMCFTFADDSTRRGRVLIHNSSGGINNSPIDEYRGVLRMQADKADQVKEQQTRLTGIRQEIRDLENAAKDFQNRLNASKAREQDHIKQGRRLKVAHQEASEAFGRLEDELSQATPDAAAIDVLQESLGEAQEALLRAEGVYEDMCLQRIELDAQSKADKKNLEEAQASVKDLDFKLQKAQATIRKYQGQREDDLKKKNIAIQQVTKAEENLKIWEEERRERQGTVHDVTQKAEAECPRRVPVPNGKSSEQLGDLLQKLGNTRRQTEKELGGSQDELLRKANEAKRIHHDAKKEFDHLEGIKMHLNNTVNNRRQRWKQFRSGISVRARVTFNYLLSERKFRGTLSIDHKNQLLDIHVQPDITERSGDGRQTKTLSGGEKSYSTVCLLLALWDAMGSPIRCLDEFDVFMDSVNRERSMEMIIQAARRSIGRQFIFITPQAMNNVKHTSDVKIIRMSDPERNQTALNFVQP